MVGSTWSGEACKTRHASTEPAAVVVVEVVSRYVVTEVAHQLTHEPRHGHRWVALVRLPDVGHVHVQGVG